MTVCDKPQSQTQRDPVLQVWTRAPSLPRYESVFLGAVHSVECANTVIGAVVLHRFVDMLQPATLGGDV